MRNDGHWQTGKPTVLRVEKEIYAAIMPSLAYLLAPIVLLFPAGTDDSSAGKWLQGQWAASTVPTGPPLIDGASGRGAMSGPGAEGLGDDSWNQVRIEQRVIIRIAPRMPGQTFSPQLRPPELPRFYERKTSKCLPIASIIGVQPDSPDRLLLMTRGRKLIGASLDKTCRARDFYSGFYVERNEDGQLCAGRDVIHSRAGANCAVTKMRELVEDDD